MKVKCSICNKEETIPNDTLYTVSEMVKKYNMGSSGFTHLFDVMFGQCLDDSTHNFDFDFTEDFKNEILAIVNKEKNIIIESENAKKESDIIVKEIMLLKEKLKETETKSENAKKESDIIVKEIMLLKEKLKETETKSENAKKESDIIVKEIMLLKEKLKETETKYEINRDRIVSLRNEHNELSSEIQKLTYIDKVDMWY
jgi:hypothetical protein